ncbi:MAG: META domain-containing protein [Methanomicrobiales archaeon]|nr:META domain-containing protein [Methanomicrobiales archaeon]NYT21491.1 META domain-containing protein [Methanomicrobiales archaeon]
MKPFVPLLLTGAFILLLASSGCTTPVPVTPPATQPPATTAIPTVTPLATSAPPQATLSGITWYLISMRSGGAAGNVLPGTEITAFFDGTGTVTGSAGCNQYTASYSGTLNNLAIGTPATTKMNCPSPPGTMSQESLYLTTFQGASRFTIEGDILTIMDSNGKAILAYSRIPPGVLTPAPLIGTTWYLNSFVDAKGTIWTPGPMFPISLQLAGDGKLSGNAGCNNYFGSYTLSGNSISIGTLGSTVMSCNETGIMDLEATYLTVLPRMILYQVSGNELTLSDGTGKMTMIYDTTP